MRAREGRAVGTHSHTVFKGTSTSSSMSLEPVLTLISDTQPPSRAARSNTCATITARASGRHDSSMTRGQNATPGTEQRNGRHGQRRTSRRSSHLSSKVASSACRPRCCRQLRVTARSRRSCGSSASRPPHTAAPHPPRAQHGSCACQTGAGRLHICVRQRTRVRGCVCARARVCVSEGLATHVAGEQRQRSGHAQILLGSAESVAAFIASSTVGAGCKLSRTNSEPSPWDSCSRTGSAADPVDLSRASGASSSAEPIRVAGAPTLACATLRHERRGINAHHINAHQCTSMHINAHQCTSMHINAHHIITSQYFRPSRQ